MQEILSNPFYFVPIALLIGCAVGLGFSHSFYVPKINLFETKLREKARSLYATNHALEKTRYELVMLASDANEQYKFTDKAQQILSDKNVEIELLKEEITILENALGKKQNVFNIRSHKTTQNKLEKVRSKQQQLLFDENDRSEVNQRKSA
jgi:ribosomal protein L7Ae-like RNA K-turn-binding protein